MGPISTPGLGRGILAVLLALTPSIGLGQRTVIQDAGGGRKVELRYNASGQVVETRTVDQAGKLEEQVEYEYRPGFLVPQETTTSYWPDGRSVRSVVRVGYDENANFTSQLIQLFDPAGKQTGGSRLAHDPFTGIYRCFQWAPAAGAYEASECPAAEESVEAPEKPAELTCEEATRLLEGARQAQREEQKARRMQRKAPVEGPVTTVVRQVGIILPAHLRPGERVSGSVAEDPGRYEGVEGLRVIPVEVPFESQGEAAGLGGWAVQAAGEGPQRADGPATFTVPNASEFTITLQQIGDPARAVSREVTVEKGSPAQKTPPQTFEAPALCLKGELCPVRGPFGGDSGKTLAAFGSRPAPIVAETEDTAYIGVPAGLPTGPSHLIVAEGSQVAAMPVDVAELTLAPATRELRQGESLLVYVTLSGPEELAEELWRAGVFPPAGVAEGARRLAPGFKPPPEGSAGVILVVVRNATPETVSLRGAKEQGFEFELTPDSFKNGEFRYHFVVEAAHPGRFGLQGTVLPFLAPVRGRQLCILAGRGVD